MPVSTDSVTLARRLKATISELGEQIISAHRGIWPSDVDCHYLVIHHKGKTKIRFNPPDVKETGWKD